MVLGTINHKKCMNCVMKCYFVCESWQNIRWCKTFHSSWFHLWVNLIYEICIRISNSQNSTVNKMFIKLCGVIGFFCRREIEIKDCASPLFIHVYFNLYIHTHAYIMHELYVIVYKYSCTRGVPTVECGTRKKSKIFLLKFSSSYGTLLIEISHSRQIKRRFV